jgi:hypothetical protein
MALRDFTLEDVYRSNARCAAFVFEGQRVTHRDYLGRIERLASGEADTAFAFRNGWHHSGDMDNSTPTATSGMPGARPRRN